MTTWPTGDVRLERRYRRLLLAYPCRFRRRHGAEIITTLLETAEPGQSRPAGRDAWHLFASGVRHRLRLPAGRPLVRVGAVLAALILGGLGAATGSWLAEQTFTELPGDAGVTALTSQVAPGGQDLFLDRSDSPWWTPTPTVFGAVDAPGWTPAPSRDRLAAAGWQVTAIRPVLGISYSADGVQMRGLAFDATRDGLDLQVIGYVAPGKATVSVMLSPRDTAVMLPAVLVGGVLGAFLGWALTAATAYRMRELTKSHRRVATVLCALSLAALFLPASASAINVAQLLHLSGGIAEILHRAVNASPYWFYATPWTLLPLTAAGVLLSVTAWAVMGRFTATMTAPGKRNEHQA